MTEKRALRQVVLDTETTGMDAVKGDRLIEIGCVEILNRRLTQSVFHSRINPEREVDAEAAKVHGMTWEVLKNEPKFEAVVDDFLDFLLTKFSSLHDAHLQQPLAFLPTRPSPDIFVQSFQRGSFYPLF